MPNPRVRDLVAAVRSAPARLGRTRLVLVDGPAGSGKTTLGDRLGAALGAQVLHGDDMYEGWGGLATLDEVLAQVLDPLAEGEPGGFRRWDWHASARAERIEVPVNDALVIEGVGVASRAARARASSVLYVEAPWAVRLARGLARDGEGMRAEWERWQAGELVHLEREGTRAAADVFVDGTAPVPD
ncbi:uridine kinase family protein [Demequina soli]|uniref:uridine kinase family protein n=1 Tax=Demequina soli TaxID=1638987 RepID=UPI000785EFEF|nr:(d)CMP kinase [Demequina soli]